MLRRVVALAGVGSVAGLVAAFFVVRVVDSMLYGLEPTDSTTLHATVALMSVVAVAPGWLPAYRASRTDAVAALTHD